jgi:hypothetical protein
MMGGLMGFSKKDLDFAHAERNRHARTYNSNRLEVDRPISATGEERTNGFRIRDGFCRWDSSNAGSGVDFGIIQG